MRTGLLCFCLLLFSAPLWSQSVPFRPGKAESDQPRIQCALAKFHDSLGVRYMTFYDAEMTIGVYHVKADRITGPADGSRFSAEGNVEISTNGQRLVVRRVEWSEESSTEAFVKIE